MSLQEATDQEIADLIRSKFGELRGKCGHLDELAMELGHAVAAFCNAHPPRLDWHNLKQGQRIQRYGQHSGNWCTVVGYDTAANLITVSQLGDLCRHRNLDPTEWRFAPGGDVA